MSTPAALMSPEEKEYRMKECRKYLERYIEMRGKVISLAPHPGMVLDTKNNTFEVLPYPEQTQKLLDKIKQMEGAFIKHYFPEFYNAKYYEQ